MNFDIGYQLLLPALQAFAKATHSWGWSIVLLTMAVRLAVWPLVAKSTRSMQKMAKLQPQLNALKERYKSEPEVFQRKSMEFFTKNKVNPMSGCWPLLIQMPILIALYGTFMGPPFGDKIIDVKVTAVDKQHATAVQQALTSNNNSSYVSPESVRAKLVVFPGESTIFSGDSINFGIRAVEGKLPDGFTPTWKIVAAGSHNPNLPGVPEDVAKIDPDGHAVFLKPGEYHVQALIPGIARAEHFLFINGLGKIARGMELLKRSNWDSLSLILLFGLTMYLSQKFTVGTPKPAPGQELDEQQLIQQQTMKTMPLITTAMFLFIPLPTGVFLYLVVSNIFQTLQTWLIMKMPSEDFIDVTEGGDTASGAGKTITVKANNGTDPSSSKNTDKVSATSSAKSSANKRKPKQKGGGGK